MVEFGKFKDMRDGYVYKTVRIGKQIWFAENFRFDCAGSAVLENDEKNLERYGRLYTWQSAMKAAPEGWHLPTKKEWDELTDFAGPRLSSDTLRSRQGWKGSGKDKLGFRALPGGYHSQVDGFTGDIGYYGNWWTGSPSERCSDEAKRIILSSKYTEADSNESMKSSMYSVRYVKNRTEFAGIRSVSRL